MQALGVLMDAIYYNLCFDNSTEYDSELVFAFFYETYLHSSVGEKECLKLE